MNDLVGVEVGVGSGLWSRMMDMYEYDFSCLDSNFCIERPSLKERTDGSRTNERLIIAPLC